MEDSPLITKVVNDIRPRDSTGEFVDGILKKIGFGAFQAIVFCLVGTTYVGYICEALSFAFIGIPMMKEWGLSPLVFSSASAGTFLGNIAGETFFSYLADRHGRFWPYLCSVTLTASLVLVSAFSPSFFIFAILRVFAAAGIGGVIVLSIPTLVEFLPIKNRGKAAIMTSIVVAFGSCATAGMAWWLIPRYHKYGWRYFIVLTSIPSFVAAIFRLIFFVESPRFLLSCGKTEEAWKTFNLMATMNCKHLEDMISKENFIIEASKCVSDKVNNYRKSTLKQLSCILKPPFLRPTICLLFVYSLQVSIAYGATLFLPYNLKNLGVDPYVSSFIAFTAEIPGIIFLAIIVEWPEFGRRNTIRLSALISAILFFLFAFIQNQITIPVLTVLIYFFLVPMITVIMTYMTETYPTEIRVMGLAFIGNITAFVGIGLPFGAGYLAEQSKTYTWLSPTVWGVMFVLQLAVALFLNHETRERNLQDFLL